ncbi:Protein of unknown function [Gryllus bimaculatus]|nr:Protein of unknown function [Gryllus bimaculatus]
MPLRSPPLGALASTFGAGRIAGSEPLLSRARRRRPPQTFLLTGRSAAADAAAPAAAALASRRHLLLAEHLRADGEAIVRHARRRQERYIATTSVSVHDNDREQTRLKKVT